MVRPASPNPGTRVTVYLRGEHLDTLRRYHPDPRSDPRSALFAMIDAVARGEPVPATPADPAAVTPSLCPACDPLDRPACPACLAAFPDW